MSEFHKAETLASSAAASFGGELRLAQVKQLKNDLEITVGGVLKKYEAKMEEFDEVTSGDFLARISAASDEVDTASAEVAALEAETVADEAKAAAGDKLAKAERSGLDLLL